MTKTPPWHGDAPNVPGWVPPAPTPVPAPSPVPVPKPEPAPEPVVAPVAPPAGQLSLETQIVAIAKLAAAEVVPKIESDLQAAVIREIAKKSKDVPEVKDTEVDISQVLTKAAARNAAAKSLGIGVAMSVVTGVTTGIASATDFNWFTKEGAMATVALLIGSVVHSVATYLDQLKWRS